MEFKKLSAVEAVQTVSDTASVLIEENGVIKRAPKHEVGGGAKKELIYEWNFSAEDEVYEILENVNDDLTWLVTKSDSVDVEIAVTQYGRYEMSLPDVQIDRVDANVTTDIVLDTKDYHAKNGQPQQFASNGWANSGYYDLENDFKYQYSASGLSVLNKKHLNFEEGTFTNVNIGGVISVYAKEGGPFKSVKIYKVTR